MMRTSRGRIRSGQSDEVLRPIGNNSDRFHSLYAMIQDMYTLYFWSKGGVERDELSWQIKCVNNQPPSQRELNKQQRYPYGSKYCETLVIVVHNE